MRKPTGKKNPLHLPADGQRKFICSSAGSSKPSLLNIVLGVDDNLFLVLRVIFFQEGGKLSGGLSGGRTLLLNTRYEGMIVACACGANTLGGSSSLLA